MLITSTNEDLQLLSLAILILHGLLVFFYLSKMVHLRMPRASRFMGRFTAVILVANLFVIASLEFDLFAYLDSLGFIDMDSADEMYAEMINYALQNITATSQPG